MFGINRIAYEDVQHYRRFLMTTFRHFGAGRESFENKVAAESEILRLEVSKLQGKNTDLHLFLNSATTNVICSVVYGRHYEYDDTQFIHLMDLVDRFLVTSGEGGSENTFPIFASLFPSKAKRELNAIQATIREYLSNIIEEHRENFDSERINDFVDAYLREQSLQSDSVADVHSFVHDENMRGHLFTLFLASGHTTAVTIYWGILYLLANPDIQSSLQSELDSVVGRTRFPRISDKVNLPYTHAVIQEIYRMSSPVPLSLLHVVSDDTTIGPYSVPKGATVVSNIWAIHRDPQLWKDPDEFRPERFIESPDNVSEVIPFSVGRRKCPVEALAQAMVFLFLTHLLHQFKFVNHEGSSQLSLHGEFGTVYKPVAFLACALERSLDDYKKDD
ncbi:cytochrome P450 2J2-like [Amphiura filiformis]|uniref:cytochrome P450 2J2-like n=1 Tax=Amphiura filiformis TaxID=82378 RepID=UPI003B224548